jgi:hypothetical protein
VVQQVVAAALHEPIQQEILEIAFFLNEADFLSVQEYT